MNEKAFTSLLFKCLPWYNRKEVRSFVIPTIYVPAPQNCAKNTTRIFCQSYTILFINALLFIYLFIRINLFVSKLHKLLLYFFVCHFLCFRIFFSLYVILGVVCLPPGCVSFHFLISFFLKLFFFFVTHKKKLEEK